MTPGQILGCLFVAATMGVGQVLFKLAARAWTAADKLGNPLNFLTSPALIGALAVYGLSAFAWMYVLRSVPLSRAYVFALMGSAVVPLFAALVFKEALSARYVIGFAIVLVGLYVSLGGKPVA